MAACQDTSVQAEILAADGVHTCMYVMHNWNVIVAYAQQRQTLANLTHTHGPELEPRAHSA